MLVERPKRHPQFIDRLEAGIIHLERPPQQFINHVEQNFYDLDIDIDTGLPQSLSDAVSIFERTQKFNDGNILKHHLDDVSHLDNEIKIEVAQRLYLADKLFGFNGEFFNLILQRALERARDLGDPRAAEVTPLNDMPSAREPFYNLQSGVLTRRVTNPLKRFQELCQTTNTKQSPSPLDTFFLEFLDTLAYLSGNDTDDKGMHIYLAQKLYLPILEAMDMKLAVAVLKDRLLRHTDPRLYETALQQRPHLQEGLEKDKELGLRFIYNLLLEATNGRFNLINTPLPVGSSDFQRIYSKSVSSFYQNQQGVVPVAITGRNKSFASGIIKARRYQIEGMAPQDIHDLIASIPDRIAFTLVVPENIRTKIIKLLQAIEDRHINRYEHPLSEENLEIKDKASGYQSVHHVCMCDGMDRPIEIHIVNPKQHQTNSYIASHLAYKDRDIDADYPLYNSLTQLERLARNWMQKFINGIF